MTVQSLRTNSPSSFSTKELSSSNGLSSPGLSQKRCLPKGLSSTFQDGFDAKPRNAAQMEKMLQGTVSALVQTVQALQQLLQTADLGGAQAGGAPGVGSCGAPGATAPGGALDAMAPDAPGATPEAPTNTLTPAAPETPSASTPGSSGATPSGDAKLGSGFPSALGQYKDAIESAASKAGVPAAMIAGQIWQESRGNLAAVSTNGGNGLTDTGLMQVNPNTFKELQAKHPELQGKDLSDPTTNILAGAFYMKDMKDQFGSWDLALRAYNSGPNGVDKSNPNAIPAGTGDATYVQKVKQFWDTISTGQGTLPA